MDNITSPTLFESPQSEIQANIPYGWHPVTFLKDVDWTLSNSTSFCSLKGRVERFPPPISCLNGHFHSLSLWESIPINLNLWISSYTALDVQIHAFEYLRILSGVGENTPYFQVSSFNLLVGIWFFRAVWQTQGILTPIQLNLQDIRTLKEHDESLKTRSLRTGRVRCRKIVTGTNFLFPAPVPLWPLLPLSAKQPNSSLLTMAPAACKTPGSEATSSCLKSFRYPHQSLVIVSSWSHSSMCMPAITHAPSKYPLRIYHICARHHPRPWDTSRNQETKILPCGDYTSAGDHKQQT